LLQNEVIKEKSGQAIVKHFKQYRMQWRNRWEIMEINGFPRGHCVVGLEMEEELEGRERLFDQF
jgi:hypothetical protein